MRATSKSLKNCLWLVCLLAPACSRSAPAPGLAVPLRLDDSCGLVVHQPDVRRRLLYELRPHQLQRSWVLRASPSMNAVRELLPRFDEQGTLVLPASADGGEPDGAISLLAAIVPVDPGSTIDVSIRNSAGCALRLLEFEVWPRSPAVLREDVVRQRELASHALAAGGSDRGELTVELTRSTRCVVILTGNRGAGGPQDAVVSALSVHDTGRRRVPDNAPFKVSVDGEMRRSTLLSAGGSMSVELPERDRPCRLELGVAVLDRPGQPLLQVVLTDAGGNDRELLSRDLARPDRPEDCRWVDLTLPLSAGAAGRLSVRLSSKVEGEAVGAAFAIPLLLPDDATNRATPERPNVLLLSIDTLRADALTQNGGHPEATPALDGFARRATSFATCVAPAPYTLPSHVTMLSGQQPAVHGVWTPDRRIVRGRTHLLAEVFRDAGLITAAFTGGGYVDGNYGFARGFDRYGRRDEMFIGRSDHLDWIDAHADQRFFLFLHTYAAHEATRLREPYLSRFDPDCPATDLHGPDRLKRMALEGDQRRSIDAEDRGHLERCYSGAVRQADDQVAKVFERLQANGLVENTVVLITSDHGEETGERGMFGHGHTLYDELLLVPLMIAGPGTGPPGRTIPGQVGVIDVAPTLLDLLGLSPPVNVQGRSLVPALQGSQIPPQPIIAEARAMTRRFAYRLDSRKLIQAPPTEGLLFPSVDEWELFDLRSDPGETHDLAVATRPPEIPETAELERELAGWSALAATLDAAFGEGARQLTGEEIERLRELGYLGGE